MTERMRQISGDAERIRADYDRTEVTGISTDGAVRAIMRGGKIVSLAIDPRAMDHDNVYVAGQVMEAIRQAEDRSAEVLTAHTSPIAAAVEELRNRLR